jgi:cytochrome c oxidase subunit 2
MILRFLLAVIIAGVLTGCSGNHSALNPQGPHAKLLANLIWTFTAVSAVVWILVVAVLLIAILRRGGARTDPLLTDVPAEKRAGGVIAACAALTAITVIGLTILSYLAQRQLFAKDTSAVTIRVTGHQWWWEVEYQDPRPDRTFTTANEIHVPIGAPITLKLASTDVIHSFWVPSIAGKMDLIPGQQNELQFIVSRPGVYRGQCAEFCGLQHAHMGMLVVATTQDEFDAWRDNQIKPAENPSDADTEKGRQVFLSRSCMLCHSIRGTPAGSRIGPDLTHVYSRRYLAAGSLAMSRGSLAAWIYDPQGIKPGANMPHTELDAQELDALAGYLTVLK